MRWASVLLSCKVGLITLMWREKHHTNFIIITMAGSINASLNLGLPLRSRTMIKENRISDRSSRRRAKILTVSWELEMVGNLTDSCEIISNIASRYWQGLRYASVNSSSAHPPPSQAIVGHFPKLSIPGVGHKTSIQLPRGIWPWYLTSRTFFHLTTFVASFNDHFTRKYGKFLLEYVKIGHK